MRRRVALGPVAVALALVVSGALLSGCGDGNGTALARQACGYVEHSLHQLSAAKSAPDAATAARERRQAYVDLRQALPIAAHATSADGQWNALMTTISESARVPITHLVVALRAQCKVARSSSQNPPPVPLTVPGGGAGHGGTGYGGTSPPPTG